MKKIYPVFSQNPQPASEAKQPTFGEGFDLDFTPPAPNTLPPIMQPITQPAAPVQQQNAAPEALAPKTIAENNYVIKPERRMRRLRSSDAMRSMVRETLLSPADFILPLFVEEGLEDSVPISSMPGVYRHSEENFTNLILEAGALGVPAVMLFGVSRHKDHEGSDSFRKGGLMDRMVSRAKDAAPDMVIMADACFCEYTDHGHCGPIDYERRDVDNDRTLENIAKQAIIAAEAGADVIAPSGMMDGQIATIRNALDQTGFAHTAIMAYSAKYASGFYGPFREAAGCSLGHNAHSHNLPKNRKTYQMDAANGNEALRETAQDIKEGADMVMVKPGLAYLDILYRVKQEFSMPTFVYNVSGEYAMLQAAAANGWLDYDQAMMEMMMAFKRAGADGIITYASLDAARILNNV